MKHFATISKQPVSASSSTVDVETKITFITSILTAFKPLLIAKEAATQTS